MLAALLLSTQSLAAEAWRPTYAGPRLSLGVALTHSGEGTGTGLQPLPWTGVGARVGTGVSVGVGPHWGMMAEVGYHSLFGTPAAARDNEYANAVRTSALHLGYGWLAVEGLTGKVRVAVGPEWAGGGGLAVGAMECEGSSDCTPRLGDGSRQRLSGLVGAGGGAAAVSYSLVEQGGFSGALGIVSGVLTDAVRWYPWGEVALLVTPTPLRRN